MKADTDERDEQAVGSRVAAPSPNGKNGVAHVEGGLEGASLSEKFWFYSTPHWLENPVRDDETMIYIHIMLLESVMGRLANRMTGEHGLTFAQFLALGCIGHEPDGVTHTQLSARLMLSTTPITSQVDRLEKAGLVRRVADPSDRRVSRVVITEEGRRRWQNVDDSYAKNCPNIPLSQAERQVLLPALARLLDAVAHDDPVVAGLRDAPEPRRATRKTAKKAARRTR